MPNSHELAHKNVVNQYSHIQAPRLYSFLMLNSAEYKLLMLMKTEVLENKKKYIALKLTDVVFIMLINV